MTLAVNDLLTVFGMALLGRGHLSYLLNNFTLQKMLYTVCEEAASEAYKGTYHLGKGGWPHFRAESSPSVWMQIAGKRAQKPVGVG